MRHVYTRHNLVLVIESNVSRFEIEYDDCIVVGSIVRVLTEEGANWSVDGVFLKLAFSDCLDQTDFLRITDQELRRSKIDFALWNFGDRIARRIVDAMKMKV